MCKKLILYISLLLLANESQACEIVAYRDGTIRTVQEITKAVNDICEITERATYQNPQTRLIAEKLLALRDHSKSISLTFKTMDICVAAGSILSQKISEIKNCVENWTRENFSKDSTTLLFQALKDFETIYYGKWLNSEEPLLDTQFFSSIESRVARGKLEGERDILAIRREMQKQDMLAAADMAEAHRRVIEAETKVRQTLITSPLTIQQSIAALTKSIEEDKLSIEKAKQKREFLPYEADLQVVKNCYELAEKHMALLKSKTELEQSKADLEQKKANILKTKTEIEKAMAEEEKARAEAKYAEVQQEIARQKAAIEIATSIVTLGKGVTDALANYADKQPKISSLFD